MNFLLQALLTAALLIAVLPLNAGPTNSDNARNARARPPASLQCDRNHLTSFSGLVTDFQHHAGNVSLTIHTEWGSLEHFIVEDKVANSTHSTFLLNGQLFNDIDWPIVESEPGILFPEMRAIAWVCEDGTTATVIDWRPPPTP